MRDPKRIDKILKKFGDYWRTYPDTRFLQLVESVVPPMLKNPDMFYIEDDVFEKCLEDFIEKTNGR